MIRLRCRSSYLMPIISVNAYCIDWLIYTIYIYSCDRIALEYMFTNGKTYSLDLTVTPIKHITLYYIIYCCLKFIEWPDW